MSNTMQALNATDVWTLLAIAGLGLITLLTRSFFVLSSSDWKLPNWVQRGLHYAPIAALAAVIVPEVVMHNGELATTWQDARLFAAAAGATWFFTKGGVLGTIVCGMVVYLPLHLGMGW
jgi:branched-subunit amino acid transport protein